MCDLQSKKKRQEEKAFVVEGKKSVQEFIAAGFQPKVIYGTSKTDTFSLEEVSFDAMKRMSSLKNPSPYLAVFPMPVPSAHPLADVCLLLIN